MTAQNIKIADALEAKLLELAKKAHGSVEIGFIDSEQAPIAFWNEFGHGGKAPAPPRPFFRNMVAKESPNWPKMMADELKSSNFDGAHTLAYMGKEIEGSLKQSIMEFDSVPLAASTIKRKGFDKQLIDTGDMLNSTTYRVSQ